MKTTLKDISKATGYSLSTISRILNGSSKYSDETQRTVIEAARNLNYSNIRLSYVQQLKSHLNVVLLTDFHEGEFYSSYYKGYVRAASNKNIRLSLVSLNNPLEMIPDYVGSRSDGYYDAAILFAPELTRKDYLTLLQKLPEGMPIVSNALIEMPVLTTITFDGYSGGHLAASHFHQKGYRKLGVVKGPLRKAESRFRLNGFIDYVQHTPELSLVFEFNGDFNFETGVKAFQSFHNSDNKPEAIFISNDLMCLGFMESALHHGYRLPKDVALLGYDDLPMCVHSNPKISSIKTDFEELANTSLQTLIQMHDNPGQQNGIQSLIPVNLVVRETS